MSAALIITPAGVVECLYTECVDLSQLGKLSVARATDIAFDGASQQWKVRDTAGRELFGHCSRLACLDWERVYLQEAYDEKHGGLK
jgi:hypothetical protein